MISEYIFNEKANRLLDYKPSRSIYGTTQKSRETAVFIGAPNRTRQQVSPDDHNPFLPLQVGVRYYANNALMTRHLLTMVGNAKRIAGYMSSESTIRRSTRRCMH